MTAIWISPVFKQAVFEPTYHGYGIQNFLDVDPHFGTRTEFRERYGAEYLEGTCDQLWSGPQINWDGKVLGCCRNFWDEFGGNALRVLKDAEKVARQWKK